MKRLQITVLTCVLLICGSSSTFAQKDIPKDFTVTLERTMCFGSCPAYTVTIHGDGTTTFTPLKNFAHRGDGPMPSLPLTGKLTPNQLAMLFSEVKKIRFFSLQTHYGKDGGSKMNSRCPDYSTDSPSAFIRIVAEGKRKTVKHYHGCQGTKILSDLVKFEAQIDKIAGAKHWTSQFGWNVGSVFDLILSNTELVESGSNKQIKVKTVAADPENDVLTYVYNVSGNVSGGKIIGTGAEVIWDLSNVVAGTYKITAGVDDGCGVCGKTVTKTIVIK